MFLEVIRGGGTPDERDTVLKALSDPHSLLHDWLEATESWAEKALGRKSLSRLSAEGLLSEAVSKNDRNDVIAFLRRKSAEGKISEEHLSSILQAGAIDVDEPSRNAESYVHSTRKILDSLHRFYPELSEELQKLASRVERGPP